MRRVAWVFLAALVAGQAAAQTDTTSLASYGDWTLPRGGHIVAEPLAHYVNHSGEMTRFEIQAERVRLHHHILEAAEVGVGSRSTQIVTSREGTTYDLTDVRVTLVSDGDHQGWWGLAPSAGGAFLTNATSIQLSPAGAAVIGNAPLERDADEPGHATVLSNAHIQVRATGLTEYHGGGALKIQGMDLRIEAAENKTTVSTGLARSGDATPVVTRTWVVLEFQAAALTTQGSRDTITAFPALSLRWDGTAIIQETTERIDGADPQGEPTRLHGSYAAELVALSGSRGPFVAAELTPIAIASAQVPTPLETFARTSWPLLALVALAGAAGLGIHAATRRRAPDLEIEEIVQLAHMAGEDGRHAEALILVRRARRMAPTSGQLAAEEAFHLGQLGQVEHAIRLYEEASELSDEGGPALDAARLLLHTQGGDDPRVASFVAVALERSPELVIEIEDWDAFEPPESLRPLIDAAYRRLGEH